MSVIEGIIRGILSVFLLIIAVIFFGGLYNGLTSNYDNDVISQKSQDGERSDESESPGAEVVSSSLERSIQKFREENVGDPSLPTKPGSEPTKKEEAYGRTISFEEIQRNKADWDEWIKFSAGCETQDPENVKDMSLCHKANQVLRKLSHKGICVKKDGTGWMTCKPNSEIRKEYPGKDTNFIRTKGTNFGSSEKIPDPGDYLSHACPAGITEANAMIFGTVNDPYALKDRCYAMYYPTIGRLQWFDKGTLFVPSPVPGGRGVFLYSIDHPKLGSHAIFIGIDPVQYQSALGTMETAPAFRSIRWID